MLPNPLDATAPAKAYARAQVKEVMSFRAFVQHIADHGGHTRGKVKGIMADMCECLVEMLLEGKKVQLDDLGDFWISLTSNGAESMETFKSNNITGVNILFTPGPDFENLLGRAEFNVVPSRVAQAATLKAEKAGEGVVDLESAKKKGSSNGGDDNPDGGGTTPGGETSGSGTTTGGGTSTGGTTNGAGTSTGNGGTTTGGSDNGDSSEGYDFT